MKTLTALFTLTALSTLAACNGEIPGIAQSETGAAALLPPFEAAYDGPAQFVLPADVGEGSESGFERPTLSAELDWAPVEVFWDRRPDLPTQLSFTDGDLCTGTAEEWGRTCEDTGVACLLEKQFSTYVGTLELGEGEKHVWLTSAQAVSDALPPLAPAAILREDLLNPGATRTNRLAGELAALRLNLIFNEEGLLGRASLAQAQVVGGRLDGWTVEAVATLADRVLAGESFRLTGLGMDLESLTDELAALNASGQGCQAATYIRRG